MRRFWKGDEGQLSAFASRFSGSADIHGLRGRRPWASINFQSITLFAETLAKHWA